MKTHHVIVAMIALTALVSCEKDPYQDIEWLHSQPNMLSYMVGCYCYHTPMDLTLTYYSNNYIELEGGDGIFVFYGVWGGTDASKGRNGTFEDFQFEKKYEDPSFIDISNRRLPFSAEIRKEPGGYAIFHKIDEEHFNLEFDLYKYEKLLLKYHDHLTHGLVTGGKIEYSDFPYRR